MKDRICSAHLYVPYVPNMHLQAGCSDEIQDAIQSRGLQTVGRSSSSGQPQISSPTSDIL